MRLLTFLTLILSPASFFLEKSMQTYLLKTLSQNCGRFVCLQLLQTLSILFENIRNETSMCEWGGGEGGGGRGEEGGGEGGGRKRGGKGGAEVGRRGGGLRKEREGHLY